MNLKIKKFELGEIKSNSYIIYNENEAFIIDPGFNNNLLIPFLEVKQLILKGIYLTHGHFDHWGGVDQLREKYSNINVYAPLKDQIWFMINEYNYWKREPKIDKWVQDGDIIDVLGNKFKVMETPGHSEGGTVLYNSEICFSGDTLFRQSVGRTDLPFSDKNDLVKSVSKMYKTLSNNHIVYPGHGPQTTIMFEKVNNPFVRG